MTEEKAEYNVDGCNAEAAQPKRRLLGVAVPRLAHTNELARVKVGSLVAIGKEEREVFRCQNCNAPHVLPDDVEHALMMRMVFVEAADKAQRDAERLEHELSDAKAEQERLRLALVEQSEINGRLHRQNMHLAGDNDKVRAYQEAMDEAEGEVSRLRDQVDEWRRQAQAFQDTAQQLEGKLAENSDKLTYWREEAARLERLLGNPGVAGLNVKPDPRRMDVPDPLADIPAFQFAFQEAPPAAIRREDVLEFAVGMLIDHGMLDSELFGMACRYAERRVAKLQKEPV